MLTNDPIGIITPNYDTVQEKTQKFRNATITHTKRRMMLDIQKGKEKTKNLNLLWLKQ